MSDRPGCLTLITDYGYGMGFVGALHAVALGIAPGATVVDLDHSVPPGDVRLGALRLERLARYLPAGVHVAVVDPGVGGTRRPIALRSAARVFVGPDNGLLVWGAEASGGIDEAVVLDNESWFLMPRSRTFDGRDVFVPVAAHLLLGGSLAEAGSPIDPLTLVRLARPVVRVRDDHSVEVEVVQVDGFGNVQLGADAGVVAELGLAVGDSLVLACGKGSVSATYATTFSDVGPGQGVVLLDSDGQLAYSLNRARADETLPIVLGGRVVIGRGQGGR